MDVALSGIVGGVIGASAAVVAVLIDAFIRKRNDRIREYEIAVFELYKDLLFFRSNHTHIVKWDEDKDPHRSFFDSPGYCASEHPNYLTAVERFKGQRYEILDLLREIKTLEVWRHKLDETLTDKIVHCLFSLTYAKEEERQRDLDNCIAELRKEWPTIDDQFEVLADENQSLQQAEPDEYTRRFRIVEGPDEEVY